MVAPAIMAAATAPAAIAIGARTAPPNSTPPGSELTMRAQYAPSNAHEHNATPSNAPVWHPFE